jgi:hypothetical protein
LFSICRPIDFAVDPVAVRFSAIVVMAAGKQDASERLLT